MLRCRTIGRAALFAAALLLAGILPAHATDPAIGAGCSPQRGNSARYDNGNNSWCNGSTWQYPAYQFGSTALGCTTTQAGMIQWTGSAFQGCDGTNWDTLAMNGGGTCSAPSGLSFTNLTGQSLNTVVTSNTATITFTGCTGALSVAVTGAATAQISVNGGAWATSGAISSGQTLQVRMTTSGTVSTLLTAAITVGSGSTNWTTTTRPASLQMFATPNSFSPSGLGGLSGADTACQAAANTAGFSGTYNAIMSSDTVSAASRLTLSYPIVNASNGATVATSNLWIGSISTSILTPSGAAVGSHPLTGTNSDGSIATGFTCTGWTTSSGNYEAGTAAASSGWIASIVEPCTALAQIYCIQQ